MENIPGRTKKKFKKGGEFRVLGGGKRGREWCKKEKGKLYHCQIPGLLPFQLLLDS